MSFSRYLSLVFTKLIYSYNKYKRQMMFCNMFLYVNNIFDSFCNKMINGRAAFLRRVLQIYDIVISNPVDS